jgi:hypothetical protein
MLFSAVAIMSILSARVGKPRLGAHPFGNPRTEVWPATSWKKIQAEDPQPIETLAWLQKTEIPYECTTEPDQPKNGIIVPFSISAILPILLVLALIGGLAPAPCHRQFSCASNRAKTNPMIGSFHRSAASKPPCDLEKISLVHILQFIARLPAIGDQTKLVTANHLQNCFNDNFSPACFLCARRTGKLSVDRDHDSLLLIFSWPHR